MAKKSGIKFRIVFYVLIALIVASVIGAFCNLRTVNQDGWYRNKYNVALYVYKYHHLPPNFLTKQQISDRGDRYQSIQYNFGGDTFYNREGHIDNPNGIKMIECDIYSEGCSVVNRGAERLVFFADGSMVYYTADHYDTFTLITLWDINGTSYVLFAVAGGLFGVQLLFATVICIAKRDGSGFVHFVTSVEVAVVSVVVVALLPIIFVMWIGECIQDCVRAKRLKGDAVNGNQLTQ